MKKRAPTKGRTDRLANLQKIAPYGIVGFLVIALNKNKKTKGETSNFRPPVVSSRPALSQAGESAA